MTRAGTGFIISLFIVYFIASQTQVGWLYLFDAVLLAILFVSAFLPRHTLKKLSVEQRVVLPPVSPNTQSLDGPLEDETLEVSVRIKNAGRLTRRFIRLSLELPFEEPGQNISEYIIYSVRPGDAANFSHHGTCYRRGYYRTSVVTLRSGGILGLFSSKRSFTLPLDLTVYPSYHEMKASPATGMLGVEWGAGAVSTAATELRGSREYHYGDPLKFVHWRNTAKRGEFMLREYERSGQGRIAVWFDSHNIFGTGKTTTLEYSIRIAAGLARLAADAGQTLDISAGNAALQNAYFAQAMGFLAVLEKDKNPFREEAMTGAGPEDLVIAVLPATVTGVVSHVADEASRGGRLAVVLLEGFSEGEDADGVRKALDGLNLQIISCRPETLEKAIEQLDSSISSAGRVA